MPVDTGQKQHWARCREWAEALNVHHCSINDHWSCCFSEEPFAGLDTAISPAVVEEKVKTFLPCKRRGELEWGRTQREIEQEQRRPHERTSQQRSTTLVIPLVCVDGGVLRQQPYNSYSRDYEDDEDDEPSDLTARLKIMYWAIKKCGGVEVAQDAFRRAVRSLEDE